MFARADGFLPTFVELQASFLFLLSKQLKSDLMKEVAYTRRKLHQASLQYYCALNALQYRKRIAMLEPMLGYTHAQVPHTCHTLNLKVTLAMGSYAERRLSFVCLSK